jgi:hypothetical protein
MSSIDPDQGPYLLRAYDFSRRPAFTAGKIQEETIMSTGYHAYSEKQRQNPMPKRMRGASATELKLKLGLARMVERLHKFQLIVAVSVLVLLLMMPAWSDRANAAVTLFTDAATYFAAAGAQTLQDFNSPISNTATSASYPDMVISCSCTDFCDSNSFKTVSSPSITGLSVFGSGPAPITFALNTPVTSFGVFIAGLGTLGPATLSVINSNGFAANAFVNYVPPNENSSFSDAVFVGLISDEPFTSVTFIDSQVGDGIFFDNAYYGPAAPVFAGTPGKANCHGQSVSALAKQYGGLNGAAAALNYSSVTALQDAIQKFCGR